MSLVHNAPVRSCCGQPPGECTCGGTTHATAEQVANTAAAGFTVNDVAYRVNPTSGKWEFRTLTSNARLPVQDDEDEEIDNADDEDTEDNFGLPPLSKKKMTHNADLDSDDLLPIPDSHELIVNARREEMENRSRHNPAPALNADDKADYGGDMLPLPGQCW